jgi:UDP-N-acetylmuramate--alanine ligase
MVARMSGRWTGRRLHFVGIGGAGMSGLALVARALGADVSGSDRAESAYCERLREQGIEPVIGHDPDLVPDGAEIVVSTAIAEENPELKAARARDAHVLHRGELLGEISLLKRCIAVSGTHGKSTTAAMVAHALEHSGREPAYLVGAEVRPGGPNAAWGDGEWLVAEADESDRSFLEVAREVAVVTNVELDHHATYGSLTEIEAAFREFAEPAATLVVWEPLDLAAGAESERIGFGIGEGDLRAEGLELRPLGSRFMVEGVEVELAVPGTHNVLNALAALGACRAAGLEPAAAAPALAAFHGAARRFEDHGTAESGARVYDDYAHHPTEVRATLEAARTLRPERLVACFQPHLYSRTARLAREFGRSLAVADLVLVLDVYPARERVEDYPGVSGFAVAAATADAAGGRPVWWTPRMEDAERLLRDRLREGDLLVTLGAGDVDVLARRLTEPASKWPPATEDAPPAGSGARA